jgi:single-strand DNA-binding protein
MASSLNKVMLIGNLGKDPEIRSTSDGREIATLTLATSESWKDKLSGERKEKTEWHRVVVFNEGLVNVIKNYVKKGNKIFVEGALQTRKWVDNTGQERYTTEIALQNFNSTLTLLDGKGSDNSGEYSAQNNSKSSQSQDNFNLSELDDEIPF